MKETIENIQRFFENYKIIYGSEIFLDGEICEPEMRVADENQIFTTPLKKNLDKDALIQKFNEPLKEFYFQIKDCQKCSLSKTRKNFVFGAGNPEAKIMFVGEAPGHDEDEKGIPFVGRAGKLLDKMLFAIGLSRDDVFIANVLKCRPPQNRDPQLDEIMHCEPYLKKQLDLISPKVLVALGRISGQVLLKRQDSLSNLRQQTHLYENIPFIVTYHPAALLRNPQWKENAWIDFKKIKNVLKN
jgi:uracil-DNA glycosylase family 4